MDLPPGTVRLKRGGGHGGHNGLRDAIAALGNNGFWRLRLGIGHPGDRRRVVEYVLSRPTKPERSAIDEAIGAALPWMDAICRGEGQAAMNRLHSHPSG